MKSWITSTLVVGILFVGQAAMGQEKGQRKEQHGTKSIPTVAHESDHSGSNQLPVPKHAVAIFQASKGANVKGMLLLEETDEGLHVWGEISGLSPGEHGFHIHEFGDLRSDDGMATGGHFSSEGHQHGDLNAEKAHEGDFGNVVADDKGVAKVDVVSKGLKLHFVLGRSFVVHAGKDDLTTQPSGNSGARIGVALIGVAKAPEPKK